MPRPTSRAELSALSKQRMNDLNALVDSLTEEQLTAEFAGVGRDRCVRDVLIHLHEWHLMVLAWARGNMAGQTQPFLPAPYTWATYGKLNVELWERHQHTPLTDARTALARSHQEVMDLISQFTDEELFTKKYFPWTGSTSLGSYCVSSTSSHYDWARKIIRAHQRRAI